jgi:hypothetical protein
MCKRRTKWVSKLELAAKCGRKPNRVPRRMLRAYARGCNSVLLQQQPRRRRRHFMSRSVHSILTSSFYSTRHVLGRLMTILLSVQSHVIHCLVSHHQLATRYIVTGLFSQSRDAFSIALCPGMVAIRKVRSIWLHCIRLYQTVRCYIDSLCFHLTLVIAMDTIDQRPSDHVTCDVIDPIVACQLPDN